MKENKLSCLIRLNKPLNITRISMICLISFFSFGNIQAKASEGNSVNEVQQASVTISGKVLDPKGEAVIGASVAVKGTTNGVVTDLDGAFTLRNVSPNSTLVVSYLGYVTQELKVGDKRVLAIQLEEDAQVLDEVVVEVGYGAVKRANLLGAVSNMDSEKIKDIPTLNLSETLYGKLPGIHLSQNNGTPGNAPVITVRKASSYSSRQLPLFVIDGVIYDDQTKFDELDPNNIESISVLKDGAAAVYGARGVGGVFLVKTKMGKEGKPKLSYSGSVGISDRTAFPEMMSGVQLGSLLNDAYDTGFGRYQGSNANLSLSDFRASIGDNAKNYYTEADLTEIAKRNYNWLDKYWSSSITTKHNLSLIGGTQDLSYQTGLSYTQQNGNIGSLAIEQYSFRVGVEAKLVKGLKGRFTIDTNTKTKRLPYNSADTSDGTMKSTFQSLMRTPSWMPFDYDGNLVSFGGLPSAGTAGYSHPSGFASSYNRSKSTNVNMNLAFTYDFSDIKPLKGLTANVSYSRTEANNRSTQYRVPYSLYELKASESGKIPLTNEYATDPTTGELKTVTVTNGNRFYRQSNYSQNYQFNLGLNYNRTFDKHNLNVMLNYEETASKGDDFRVWKELIAIYGWESFDAFSSAYDGGNSFSNSARRAYIGRVNYSYADKYLVESSFRYESSSLFPSNSRWAFFPSVSLGWRISEESWFNVKFIDSAKIRSSLGLVGDDSAKSNQWLLLYGSSNTSGYLGGINVTGIEPKLSGTANADLQWETTFFSNYGVDLRLFKDFDLGFDYWMKNTWDILDANTSDYPTTTGIDKAPKRNYGRMKAWGYDISLGYNGRINKDMSYRIGANISWSDNKIKNVIQAQANVGTWKDQIGRRSDGGLEGYKCLGIIRTQEQLDAILAANPGYLIFNKAPELGMLYYEDVAGALDENGKTIGDGVITDADIVRLKDLSSNPYSFGFNLNYTWKSLSFDAQFTGSFGGYTIMNKNDYAYPSATANGLSMWTDHWTLENPNASMPRASIKTELADADSMVPSNFWIKKGTEMRLRNATLSYNVPKTLSTKLGLSSLRVYVTGTNLFTLISPFDYKDPTLSYYDSYPIMRTVNFGLSITL